MRRPQNFAQSSSWFWRLLSKCQNHKDDCANFWGLLKKAELYIQSHFKTEGTLSDSNYECALREKMCSTSLHFFTASSLLAYCCIEWKNVLLSWEKNNQKCTEQHLSLFIGCWYKNNKPNQKTSSVLHSVDLELTILSLL